MIDCGEGSFSLDYGDSLAYANFTLPTATDNTGFIMTTVPSDFSVNWIMTEFISVDFVAEDFAGNSDRCTVNFTVLSESFKFTHLGIKYE